MPIIANCIMFAADACTLVIGQVDWHKPYTPATVELKPPALIGEQIGTPTGNTGVVMNVRAGDYDQYQSPAWHAAKKKLKAMIGDKTIACIGFTHGRGSTFGADCYVSTKHGTVNIAEEINKLRTGDIR